MDLTKCPTTFVAVFCAASTLLASAAEPLPPVAEVRSSMEAVAAWQETHPTAHSSLDWTVAPYDLGLLALSRATGDAKWADIVRAAGRKVDWKLGGKPMFGDDHAVGQVWLDLYFQDQQPEQLAAVKEGLKAFTDRPLPTAMDFTEETYHNELVWCDSLFMSPPGIAALYTATGDQEWLTRMDVRYWALKNYLYDEENHLFFRDSRFFEKKEANGKKVFWGRGNGWVVAGLPHVLEHIPVGHPLRPKYEKLFQEMVARVIELQQPDGSWHASLLDPESFSVPESSSTAFFCYGILWGVNQGLVDREKGLPAALKAWALLKSHIHEDGKLGFVQPIGEDPQKVTADMTEVYGSGALLLAGSELSKLIQLENSRAGSFKVANDSKINRINEVVGMDWSQVTKLIPNADAARLSVIDVQTGRFCATQVLTSEDKPTQLLFTATVQPESERQFRLVETKEAPVQGRSRIHVRYVPERMDDFAYENDRFAGRFYGPKLVVENGRGGIDVWMKRTRELVQDRWFAGGKYHDDVGEGCDCYHVGATLGAGGLGYLAKDGSVIPSPVYKSFRIISNGPLRAEFELEYAPLEVPGGTVAETRRVVLDLGTNFLSLSSRFVTTGKPDVQPVTGLRTEPGEEVWNTEGAVAVSGATEGKGNGLAFTGLIAAGKRVDAPRHTLIVLADDLSHPVSWSSGAGFSNATDFPVFKDWQAGVTSSLARKKAPLHLNF